MKKPKPPYRRGDVYPYDTHQPPRKVISCKRQPGGEDLFQVTVKNVGTGLEGEIGDTFLVDRNGKPASDELFKEGMRREVERFLKERDKNLRG